MTSPHQQKLRITGPVIITANRLADGAVVHRTAESDWSESLSDAQVLTDAASAQEALRLANADGLRAVGAYVAAVGSSEGDVEPGNLRESIRANGPTFRLPSDDPAYRIPGPGVSPGINAQVQG